MPLELACSWQLGLVVEIAHLVRDAQLADVQLQRCGNTLAAVMTP